MKGAAEHRVFTKLSNSDEDSKLSAFTMVSGADVHELVHVSGVSCKEVCEDVLLLSPNVQNGVMREVRSEDV